MQTTILIIPTAFVLTLTIIWLIATDPPRLARARMPSGPEALGSPMGLTP